MIRTVCTGQDRVVKSCIGEILLSALDEPDLRVGSRAMAKHLKC